MNRRPIAARNLAAVQAVSAWLTRRGASANAISLASLAFGAGSGIALAATAALDSRGLWLAGAVLVQLRLVANMLDGMVAERLGAPSVLGELYNELPDRVSDVAILVGLGYAAGGDATLGYLAALGALLTAYVRALAGTTTGRQFFEGPMAKQQRMAVVTVVALAGTMAPGWIARPVIGDFGLPALALGVIAIGAVVTAWRRLRRIASDLAARASHG